jgi:hypothetical protein
MYLGKLLIMSGPPGDLTNVLKAEKDLQDVRAKANKESADSRPKPNKEVKDATETKPKPVKDKDDTKKVAKDDKPKQPRTIAIAPRPRANSGSDATPPIQPQSNTAHFNPVQLKETSSGPIVLSPLPEFNRELPVIPDFIPDNRGLMPSVLEPVTPGAPPPPPPPAPGSSVFANPPSRSIVPVNSPIPMPDLSQPGWTSDRTGLSRRLDGERHHTALHEEKRTPRQARSSPKSSSRLPLYTNEPLASPTPASGSQSPDVDMDMIEPGSAKAPRKSKLAQEIRPEEANAAQ